MDVSCSVRGNFLKTLLRVSSGIIDVEVDSFDRKERLLVLEVLLRCCDNFKEREYRLLFLYLKARKKFCILTIFALSL